MHLPKTMDEITAHLHSKWKQKLFATINPPNDELHKHGRIVSRQTFIDNPHIIWNKYDLLDNDEITVDDMINHKKYTNENYDDFWYQLSRHKKVTFDYIFSHNEYPWITHVFEQNPNLTIQIILEHPNIHWNWEHISLYCKLSIQDITTHFDLPWNWTYLSQNFRIDYIDKLKHKHLPWNWTYVCSNNIHPYRLERVVKNLELPWNWQFMHICRGVTSDFVKQHIDKNWNWIGLLQQNIVNFDFVTKYCSQQLDWHNFYYGRGEHENKQAFVDFWIVQTCLAIILKTQCSLHPTSLVDYVFADEYIIKLIAKY
jgi:hypothetical protein